MASKKEGVTLPHSLDAEKAVLGALIVDDQHIAEVFEILTDKDFYYPYHQRIFGACKALHENGKRIDLLLLNAALEGDRDYETMGSATYLSKLMDGIPKLVNVKFYAQLVKDRAIRRTIIKRCINTADEAQDTDGEMARILASLAEDVVTLTQKAGGSRKVITITEAMEQDLDELEAEQTGRSETRVPTGLPSLTDKLNGGMLPGQLVILGARPAMGKALWTGTRIATPSGWTTMGLIRPGDVVYDETGSEVRVLWKSETRGDREMYRVSFDDGSSVIACRDHQWVTRSRAERRSGAPASVKTTAQIAEMVKLGARANHSIDLTEPVKFPERELPIPPYTLGAWLGDGDTASGRVTKDDDGIFENIARDGFVPLGDGRTRTIKALKPMLRSAGVLGGKYIPTVYLRSSVQQRMALLAGLMDTDGWVENGSMCQITQKSREVAESILSLVRSLGCKAWMKRVSKGCQGGFRGIYYNVGFTSSFNPFRLERKASLWKRRSRKSDSLKITSVEPVSPVNSACIAVDGPSKMFLCGEEFIPTHNSALTINTVREVCVERKDRVLMFSLEMTAKEISKRLRQQVSRISQSVERGRLHEDDWGRVVSAFNAIKNSPFHIDESPDLDISLMRAKARRFFSQYQDTKLIIVDHMHLMGDLREDDEFSERSFAKVAKGLKAMARELNVPVMALAQLNRGVESRMNKRPQLADLKRSGDIEAAADVVMFLYRDEYYRKREGRPVGDSAGRAEIIVAKHRDGGCGTIRCRFSEHLAMFEESEWKQDTAFPVSGDSPAG